MARSSVKGYRQTAKNIRSLKRNLDRPIGEASRAALKPIQVGAKANLVANNSVKRGVLHKSIVIRKHKKRLRDSVTWQVAASGRGISHAHLVEFGTEPHFQPKRGVMHPGAEAKPFLTPAFYDNDQLAIRLFGKTVGQAMEDHARRLGRRQAR